MIKNLYEIWYEAKKYSNKKTNFSLYVYIFGNGVDLMLPTSTGWRQ